MRLTLLLLLACSDTWTIDAATPRSVTVRYDGPGNYSRQRAADMAEAHCQKYGKHAEKTDGWNNPAETSAWTTWKCVD